MKPKRSRCEEPQEELLGILLERLVRRDHALVRLSRVLDWVGLERKFDECYANIGRPGEPLRLMLGLEYLKYTYDLSDEEVVERWKENPYWQYFCGEKYFQYNSPIDPTSMGKFRKRIGERGAEGLLEATIKAGLKLKVIAKRDFNKVVVDTTVQEKAITYPTDSKLYHKMRVVLVKLAKAAGIELRQSYVRVGRKALVQANRYFHARQHKRARRQVKKLRTYLGRVMRDIARKIAGNAELEAIFSDSLKLAQCLLQQKKNDKNKIYSIHEPDVECIAKGKAHKRYEFGNKVSVATTARSSFIVGVKSFHGNPYDGHTLAEAIEQVECLTQTRLSGEILVDRGYRGHDYKGEADVHVVGNRKLSSYQKRGARRRSVVEAKIGHMKNHSRMNRNFLRGKFGDCYNAILCGVGVNLRRLIGEIYLLLHFWLKLLLKRQKNISYRLSPRTKVLMPTFQSR